MVRGTKTMSRGCDECRRDGSVGGDRWRSVEHGQGAWHRVQGTGAALPQR